MVVAFLVVVVAFVVVVVVVVVVGLVVARVVVVTGAAAFPTAENWSIEASRSTMPPTALSTVHTSSPAVTEFMFQNVQVCAVQHIQVSIIRQPLPPVTAASADGREALCCPEVHIEPFARINIVGIHEVLHPRAFGRCTWQLVRNGFIAIGGVIGAVVVANQGVIDHFIRLQGFFGVLSC